METALLAALPQKLLRRPQGVPVAESADPGQKFLPAASSKKKLSVRNFPPKFSDREAMETAPLAALPQKPLKQPQGVPAAESAAPGQKFLPAASSKKKRVRNFPPIFWT